MRRAFSFLLITCGAAAAFGTRARAADQSQLTAAFFSELQERGPSTPEELADRAKTETAEAASADAALNDWKLCVIEAVNHWADLGQGPGTLVDGAFGRCGDTERDYRTKLIKVNQGGRMMMDLQFARAMMRGLEDSWRPRLIAMALDQDLARKKAAPPPSPAPTGKIR